jgi:ADP-ribosylglycohydrolase
MSEEMDAARGALYGLAMGDALGAPHEFTRWNKHEYDGTLRHRAKVFYRFQNRELWYAVGQTTDDTEMTMALLGALVKGRGEYRRDLAVEAYLAWANSGNIGMGKNTRALFKKGKTVNSYEKAYAELYGTEEQRQKSQSNGCLMRCSPLAIMLCIDHETRMKAAERDCRLTNPSDVAVDACRTYVTLLAYLIHEERTPGDSIREFASAAIAHALQSEAKTPEVKQTVKDATTPDHQRDLSVNKGHVLHGLYATVRCLAAHWLDVHTPYTIHPRAMAWCIELHPNSDTDTNAAIVGAAVGALVGWEMMEIDETTKDNLEKVMHHQHAEPRTDFPRRPEYTLVYADRLLDKLLSREPHAKRHCNPT